MTKSRAPEGTSTTIHSGPRPLGRMARALLAPLLCAAALSSAAGCDGGDKEAPSWGMSAAHAQAPGSNPNLISDVAERSLPSVVHIATATAMRRALPFGGSGDEAIQPQGLGSGVIISKDGLVLTNNHVVQSADRIQVSLSDGRSMEATVIGLDPKSDLAVLRLKGDVRNIKPIKLGNSADLRLGEFVLAIGNPFGLSGSVTLGIVSAKGRANVGIVDYEDFIQTDAAINPGNSGGALVNMKGELVGINTAIMSRSGGYQGIGFAIPTNMAEPIMKALIKDGKVRRGWLGVSIEDVTPELARSIGLKEATGVRIRGIQPGSPAAKAGLRVGDVILSVKGTSVDTSSRLRNLVALIGADKSTSFSVFRDGQTTNVDAKLGELPD